jgi:hypothetical protein
MLRKEKSHDHMQLIILHNYLNMNFLTLVRWATFIYNLSHNIIEKVLEIIL